MTIRPTRRPARRGSVLPLLAVCVVALFGFVALAIDIGMLMVARTECQNAADAAALAGVRTLDNKVPSGTSPDAYHNNRPEAETNARAAVMSNIFLNTNFTDSRVQSLRVGLYDYSTSSQTFSAAYPDTKPSGKAWSAVEVIVNGNQPTYFGRVLGINTMPMTARAVAVHRPRDLALVLDYTGSMGYGTTFTYTTGRVDQSSYRAIYLSGDTVYPQFGHYQRYLSYRSDNPNANQKDATVANRPNPFYNTATVISAPYVYAPANMTLTTDNGPPVIRDFLYDPAASGPTVTTSVLTNAFHAQAYASTRTTAGALLTAGPTPAPANFADQSDSPTAFDSDKWPRKRGHVPAAPGVLSWSPTSSTGAAINLQEYLGWAANYTSGSTLPDVPYSSYAGRSQTNFRDATWERYGYDLDVADYIANRGAWDPRWDWDPSQNAGAGAWAHNRVSNPTTSFRPRLKPADQRFKGYTMGPGYWGKTFFMWPPDPRAANDWRLKFFKKADGTNFLTQGTTAQVDADTVNSGNQTINGALMTDGTGTTLKPRNTSANSPYDSAEGGTTYDTNYSAILAWIKSGPQVFPPNLRAGRVRYYTSIPNDVNTGTGTPDEILDKRFWKAYIDFVLAPLSTDIPSADITVAGQVLAGLETQGWPEGVTPDIYNAGELTGYDPPDTVAPSGQVDPRPYMHYKDNPSRPRMHLWFGPISLYSFIDYVNLQSGTIHQAQSWQLKAGVNSALDDIKANHPNDLVGMAFFTKRPNSPTSQSYRSIMVPIGQDWTNLKNALFFPRTKLEDIRNGINTSEVRPYNDSLTYTGWTDVPNAQNNTDPNTGLAMAFNILAPSQYVNTDPARRGRRGATKIVIFETDGIPNAAQQAVVTPNGYDTYYSMTGLDHPSYPDTAAFTITNAPCRAAYEIVDQIRKPMLTTNGSGQDSGLSQPNNPSRVYAIGFGDIFSTSAGPNAAAFLLEIQKRGGTSRGPVPGPADTSIPAYQIITGTYTTRIANLRTALERILQSGVQVTLIE